jgi:hypothetical protein
MLVELLIIKELLTAFVELTILLETFVELELFEGGGIILTKVTLSINGEN